MDKFNWKSEESLLGSDSIGLKYKNLIVKMKDNIHEASIQVQNIGIIWGTKEY